MTNFPNMSYCMCENTLAALHQLYEAMRHEDAEDFIGQMNKHERAAFNELAQMCRLVADTADEVDSEYTEYLLVRVLKDEVSKVEECIE